MCQCCHQPAAGKTAIKNQKIVRFQQVKHLKQHLPLVAHGFMQRQVEKQLDTRQKQAKHDAIDDRADLVNHYGQSHLAAVGRHHTQSMPAWRVDLRFNQRQQLPIDCVKDRRLDLVACLREGLGGNDANGVGPILQMGEELVEFGLNGALHA